MDPASQQIKINPLTSLMRQPKIYIKLPSQGKYWPAGTIDMSPNGEYAVYSMTARDELMVKTPDALLNGQGTVSVIQNCVPAIKDAWQIPSIDLDVILIAIRLATYGDKMEMSFSIGEEEMSYGLDLRALLDQLYSTLAWDDVINIGSEIAIYIKPVNYQAVSSASIQTFETQKLMSLVNNSSLTEEEKINTFRESFKKLTDLTVGIINSSVYKIESSSGGTEDPKDIEEFLNNCDKYIFDAIKDRLDALRIANSLKPMKVKATPEMLAAGSAEEVEIPLTFDPSNFFV